MPGRVASCKGCVDVSHLARVSFRRLRVQFDEIGAVCQRQLRLHGLLACLQLVEAVADLRRAASVLDLADEPLDLAVDLSKLPLERGAGLGCFP